MTLRLDEEETRKHGLTAGPGLALDAPTKDDVELCVVLGGDGTILRALQRYAGTGGAGVRDQLRRDRLPGDGRAAGHRGRHPPRVAAATSSCCACPAIVLEARRRTRQRSDASGRPTAINDVAIHRKVGERVAELAYALDGEEAGSVRCDGLVVATPAGSTGYNLANGGPVMAWGVEGFVVSFIAPHSMTRACAGRRARTTA